VYFSSCCYNNLFKFTFLIIFVILITVEARNQFKEFVNTVATIRNEEVNMYMLHTKIYSLHLILEIFILKHVS
jgi:hypothetical protein